MISKPILLNYIKEQEKEFSNQIQSIQKECRDSLRDMNYDEVIIHSVNLHTLRSELVLLESLKSKIECGLFDIPGISSVPSSCCGEGECEKQ